jgi:hypothetical protein
MIVRTTLAKFVALGILGGVIGFAAHSQTGPSAVRKSCATCRCES